MNILTQMKCMSYEAGETAITETEITEYLPLIPDWKIVERDGVRHLERVFNFKNFSQALAFTNKVGALAEEEDHHPSIQTEWGGVTVTWWTHKVKGLHLNDFIMAAKTDVAYSGMKSTR